jgi:hypothetical protein
MIAPCSLLVKENTCFTGGGEDSRGYFVSLLQLLLLQLLRLNHQQQKNIS